MTKKPDPKKVSELKEKAREAESNINETLYGVQTENQNAEGAGEFG